MIVLHLEVQVTYSVVMHLLDSLLFTLLWCGVGLFLALRKVTS